MKLRLLLLFLLASLWPLGSRAQWTMTGSELLDIKWLLTHGGALEYSNGTIWAGSNRLMYSSDLGATWKETATFMTSGDWISCIRFWNDTGLVSTSDGRLFRSTDRGATWTDIFEESAIGGVAFNGSSRDILLLMAAPGEVLRSTDAGASWSRASLGPYGQDIVSARQSMLATATDLTAGYLYHSTDRGANWSAGSTGFNYDSFSLSVDSCTDNVYIVNEEERNPTDGICRILITTDQGRNWSTTFTHDRSYLSGAIVAGPTTLFAATLVDGVLRSTDHGIDWEPIGGPNIREDTRFVLPVSDNVILAVDQDGSIWRTTNSGGSPITVPATVFSLSRTALFANVTVGSCGEEMDSLEVTRVVGACNGPLEIVKQEITGPDAKYYTLLDTASGPAVALDTIAIQFHPDSSRDYTSSLVLTLWDGETRIVPLGGHGTTTPHIVLSAPDISTDVIGDDLLIPIRSNMPITRSCDLRVRYDATSLEYKGLELGFTAVTERSVQPGHIVLHRAGSNTLAVDSILAVLRFRYIPLSSALATITIDSLAYASDSACGDYVAAKATITSTASECSRDILARYVKTGEPPVFTITPNPASDAIHITSNRETDATVHLFNALGTLLATYALHLSGTPASIDAADLPEGMITISLESGSHHSSHRLLIIHR